MINNAAHGNSRHHLRSDVGALEGIAEGQCVHHGCQHAHVVASDSIEASFLKRLATKKISAANHQPDLYPNTDQLTHLEGELV